MTKTTNDRTLREAQESVDAWVSQWEGGYWEPLANLARLTEEVGELAAAINENHGPKPLKTGAEKGSVTEEIGDVFFVLIALANDLDVDLQSALANTLRKFETRDADRFERKAEP